MATDVLEDGIQIDDLKIGKTVEYAYLGQILSCNNKTDKEIAKRIANGWKVYWAHRQIFKSKMSISTKIRVFQSCIIPVLTYGAQTWTLIKNNMKRLRTTQYATLRSILGVKIKDKLCLNYIRGKTNCKNMGYTIIKLKFKYAGHMAREGSKKWNYKTTVWTPYDKKRKKVVHLERWHHYSSRTGMVRGSSEPEKMAKGGRDECPEMGKLTDVVLLSIHLVNKINK